MSGATIRMRFDALKREAGARPSWTWASRVIVCAADADGRADGDARPRSMARYTARRRQASGAGRLLLRLCSVVVGRLARRSCGLAQIEPDAGDESTRPCPRDATIGLLSEASPLWNRSRRLGTDSSSEESAAALGAEARSEARRSWLPRRRRPPARCRPRRAAAQLHRRGPAARSQKPSATERAPARPRSSEISRPH